MTDGCPLAQALEESVNLLERVETHVVNDMIARYEDQVSRGRWYLLGQAWLVCCILLSVVWMFWSLSGLTVDWWFYLIALVFPMLGVLYIMRIMRKTFRVHKNNVEKLEYWQTNDFTAQDASDFNPLAPPAIH